MRLEGKVAIVTGASSGMGRDIASLFAKEGATVLAVARRMDRLDELAKETAEYKGKIVPFAGDMLDKSQVEGMIDQVVSKYGKLDILVNNAGIMDDFSPVGDVSDDMWEKVLRLNLDAPMYAMRKAVNLFLSQKNGVILNIASIGGLYGCRAGAAYTAAKHALVGLTKNTAYMYAKKNIRCNAICPGAIETEVGTGEFMQHINQEGMGISMAGIGVNPRSGKGNEIAQAALFLVSDAASFVNGQCLAVDGGWTAY